MVMQFTDTASAGNGGVATASANGGAVRVGDVNSGGNAGSAIGVGDTWGGDVGVDGGTMPTAPRWASPPMAAPPSRTPPAAITTSPSSARTRWVSPRSFIERRTFGESGFRSPRTFSFVPSS